jgi:hypothetical protein
LARDTPRNLRLRSATRKDRRGLILSAGIVALRAHVWPRERAALPVVLGAFPLLPGGDRPRAGQLTRPLLLRAMSGAGRGDQSRSDVLTGVIGSARRGCPCVATFG